MYTVNVTSGLRFNSDISWQQCYFTSRNNIYFNSNFPTIILIQILIPFQEIILISVSFLIQFLSLL